MMTLKTLVEGKRLDSECRRVIAYHRKYRRFPKEAYDLRVKVISFCGDATVAPDGGDSELRFKNKLRRSLERLP